MKMTTYINLAALSFAITSLTSCGSLLPKATPKEIFILGAKQEQLCESRSDKGSISNIQVEAAAEFFSTQKIVFREDSQLGNYQFSEWSQPLTERIEQLVTEKLRCQGYQIGNHAPLSNKADFTIKINILDFSHDAASPPGQFRGVFRVAKMVGIDSQEKLFSFQSPATSFDVIGARQAADKVVEQLLLEIVKFVS